MSPTITITSNVVQSATSEASILVECTQPLPGNISSAIYGGFIEFLGFCINGPTGMWAQEFRNRGFDEPDEDNDGISGKGELSWQPLIDPDVSAVFSLSPGGYNKNGVYAQKITKVNGTGRVGIYQNIIMSNTADLDFYVYLRGNASVGEVTVALTDINGTVTYAREQVGIPEDDWKKFSVSLPHVTGIPVGRLEIFLTGNGSLWVDEASLMPSDNVGGVRKEFFDLYQEWQPGVLRYPGGCFADSPANHWEYGIGPIDQRKSPNWDPHWGAYQRMDFGVDEFITFCKACNIEPHFTVNFGSGTVEEAVALVEYCNGPVNSLYGALRAANGHPEPYNVKYWEIGNEQYGKWEIGHPTPEEYGTKFIEYYQAMKAVDPTIRIMADGDIDPKWYQPMLETVGKKIDIFGWHECHTAVDYPNDETTYLSMMARSVNTENTVKFFWDKAWNLGLAPHTRLSISEWWPVYRYLDNTSERFCSIESALWSALHLNVFQRNADALETGCRTVFIGVIASVLDSKTGSRAIFGTPTYHVFKMYRKYSGDKRLAVEVDCPTYNALELTLGETREIPYLDASATTSNSSIFLAVVNRHPTDAIQTKIEWNGIQPLRAMIHEINGDSYLDGNTIENPDKITIVSFPWEPQEYYSFPPHSVTIIELTEYVNGTDTFSVNLRKPSENHVYIFNKEGKTLKHGTVIFGGITVNVDCYSGNEIKKVEFSVDDTVKFIDYEEPYEWFWDEPVVGYHEIIVAAYDARGNLGSDRIAVMIFNVGNRDAILLE